MIRGITIGWWDGMTEIPWRSTVANAILFYFIFTCFILNWWVKYWSRFSGKILQYLSLGVFKTQLETVLRKLIKLDLLWAGGCTRSLPEVPSNLIILWFCDFKQRFYCHLQLANRHLEKFLAVQSDRTRHKLEQRNVQKNIRKNFILRVIKHWKNRQEKLWYFQA